MFKQFFPGFLVTMLLFSTIEAQVTDSLKVEDKPKLVTFIPAAAEVTYGFVALNTNALRRVDDYIHKRINRDNHSFYTTADDYLRYVPALAVYGLDLFGVEGKHNFRDKTTVLLIAGAVNSGVITALKASSNRMRPNRLNDYSFPSGHAATAFASAEFLRQEYGDVSVWYTIGGYGIATTTAVLRLYKNYHWFSDVVAGAGIGILSTKFAYLVYPAVERALFKKKKSNLVMLPVYQNGGAGLVISGKF